jgi:hypothetical protein
METLVIDQFIEFGQAMGGELLSSILLLLCYALILSLWRFYGVIGLYLYNIVAVIAANIQVLKTTPFFLSSEPVALGTLLFATTFLVSDIITEHNGLKTARRGIVLCFLAQILITLLMLITLAYPYQMSNADDHAQQVQTAMYILFAPSLRLLIASLSSYCLSQWIDIKIFKAFKDYTGKKLLWLRINVATLTAGLIDNIIFSLLAWVILNPHPVAFKTLVITYILGTYGARAIVSITSTPIVYLTYKFHPSNKYEL